MESDAAYNSFHVVAQKLVTVNIPMFFQKAVDCSHFVLEMAWSHFVLVAAYDY